MSGKIVAITGASGGIGSALVRGFQESGADVVSIGRREDDIFADLSMGADWAIGQLLRDKGRIDVLINCAGVSLSGYDNNSWDKAIWVNLRSVFSLCRGAAMAMADGDGGSIINITSIGAHVGFPNNPAYQASKSGLRGLTRALAVDFGSRGVRVNNVCPGYVRTRMTEGSFGDPELKSNRDKHIVLGRWGRPEDLVGACVFLASDASSYVTGTDIVVDGGWLAKGL